MNGEPKWDYERFKREIQELQAKDRSKQIEIDDLKLRVDQHQLALINAQQGMFKGLTQNPHPWDAEQQKIWDEAAKKPVAKMDLKQTNRLLAGKNLNQLPY